MIEWTPVGCGSSGFRSIRACHAPCSAPHPQPRHAPRRPVAAAADKGPGGQAARPPSARSPPPRAVGVTATHVTLQASVVPGAAGTAATFEYGPTADYGFTAAAMPAQLPRNGATASASIDGLTPSTTYHFRVVLGRRSPRRRGRHVHHGRGPPPSADQGATPPATRRQGRARPRAASPQRRSRRSQAPDAPVLGESVAVGPRAGTVQRPLGRRQDLRPHRGRQHPGRLGDRRDERHRRDDQRARRERHRPDRRVQGRPLPWSASRPWATAWSTST